MLNLSQLMKKLPSLLSAVAFAAIITATPALAQKPDLSKKTLDDWSFGEILVGEPIDKEKLKGQVVVIEYWGVN